MEVENGEVHLGDLPSEVINYILKWVVSKELDLRFANFPFNLVVNFPTTVWSTIDQFQVTGESCSSLQRALPCS